ncbi:MAG: phosphatase PAP2 family protein, partial [Muribaculaceae bacterium]|nr:phosphatase PAP2 family protein [Muribaculaceae bacterium]
SEIMQADIKTPGEEMIQEEKKELAPVEINTEAVGTVAVKPAVSPLDSIVNASARIISILFSPMFIPTYAILLAFQVTVLHYVQPEVQWLTLLVTLALTGFVPMVVIMLLYGMKIVTSTSLERRKERIIPYSAAFLGYCGCALYLNSVHAPSWLWLFVAAGAVALLIVDVVNLWWKISAHAAAMGGFIGFTFFIIKYGQSMIDLTHFAMLTIIVAGLVCTSRLILNRHTLWQIAAGLVVGFASVMLLTSMSGVEEILK